MEHKNVYKLLIKPNGQSLFDAIEIAAKNDADRGLELFNQLVIDYQSYEPNFKLVNVKLQQRYNYLIPAGSSLLYFAAAVGSIPIIKLLLEDEEIKKTINNKRTVLDWVPGVRPEYVETPLSVSILYGHFETVKFLLLSGATFDPDQYYRSRVYNKEHNKINALIDLYRYKADIDNEKNSFFYKEITCKLKDNFSFFKEKFPYDKAVKLQLANLLVGIFEGKQGISAINQLTTEQKAYLEDGRLKAAYEQITQQKLIPNHKMS